MLCWPRGVDISSTAGEVADAMRDHRLGTSVAPTCSAVLTVVVALGLRSSRVGFSPQLRSSIFIRVFVFSHTHKKQIGALRARRLEETCTPRESTWRDSNRRAPSVSYVCGQSQSYPVHHQSVTVLDDIYMCMYV